MPYNLKKFLLFHAAVTLLAGLVLIVFPAKIPNAINIELNQPQYLLCYFLGAAEIAIAYLSFAGRTLDSKGLRIVSTTIIIFHLLTLAAEIYAWTQGADSFLWINICVRMAVVAVFYYYGIKRLK